MLRRAPGQLMLSRNLALLKLPDRQNVGIKHTNSDKDPNSKEAIPTVKDDKVKPEILES